MSRSGNSADGRILGHDAVLSKTIFPTGGREYNISHCCGQNWKGGGQLFISEHLTVSLTLRTIIFHNRPAGMRRSPPNLATPQVGILRNVGYFRIYYIKSATDIGR